jgi:hypothetical protein
METLMNGTVFIEATLLSLLFALWATWIALRGLFRLMPGIKLQAVPTRDAARSEQRAR